MKVSIGIKAKNGEGILYDENMYKIYFQDNIQGANVDSGDIFRFRTNFIGEGRKHGSISLSEAEWIFIEFDGLGKKSINWIKKEDENLDIKSDGENIEQNEEV